MIPGGPGDGRHPTSSRAPAIARLGALPSGREVDVSSNVGHQLRWWAGEYRGRGVDAAVRHLPASRRIELMSALERRDGGYETDFGHPGPYRETAVVEEHVVARAALHVVPGTPDHPREDGHHWPDRSVFRLRDCRVDLATGLVFHDGLVLAASGAGWRSARDASLLSGAGARAERVTGSWPEPLTAMGRPHNYCHFFIEAMPRVLHVRRVAPDAVPVFAGPLPAYVPSVLDTLGIEYRVVTGEPVIHSDDVLVCEPIPKDWPHPDDFGLLRSAVDAAVPAGATPGPERVYVTRRRSSRTLHDEGRLEAALTERGFTVVAMEDLSFPDQIRVVRDARIIAAPHGTGLTNAIFAAPGTVILEIAAGHWWNTAFRNHASLCGQPHRLVPIRSTPDAPHGAADDAIAGIDAALAELLV